MEQLLKILSYSRWLSALIIALALVALLIGGLALQYVEMCLVAATGESRTLAAVAIADKLDMLMAEVSGDIRRMADSQTVHGTDVAATTRYLEWMVTAFPVYGWLGMTVAGGRSVSATSHARVGQDRRDGE